MNKSGEIDSNELIRKLQLDNELKTRLIGLLVHDFSGLFSNIQWLLNAYEKKLISEEQFLSMVPEINQQVERNQTTFADTCNWVSAQVNREGMIFADVNVLELLTKVKEELEMLWAEKEISLHFVADSSLFIHVDVVLIRFIIHKIVENAIKYSYNGSCIEIEVKRNNSVIHLSIKDEGVGMNHTIMDTLFTLNGNPTTGTKNEKGAGLSLVVAKELMNRLGGEMKVSSKENNGTVFELLFPIKE